MNRTPGPKKMGKRLNPPRCILCGGTIKEGESYHQLSHGGVKTFHASCYKALFEKQPEVPHD